MKISQVKKNLERTVLHNGQKYKFSACIMRMDINGNYTYEAELRDLQARSSVLVCDLKKIEEI